MNPGGAGDLTITIGGDLTPLETALASVPEAFAGVTSEVQDAFAGLGTSIDMVAEGLNTLGAAATEALEPVTVLGEQLDLFGDVPLTTIPEVGAQLQLFATYCEEAGSAAEGAAVQTESFMAQLMALAGEIQGQVATSMEEMNVGFGSLFASMYLVKSAATALETSYADLQSAQLALAAMLGNTAAADAAIDSVKQLSNAFGVAQESAITMQQKLIAIGEPLSQIPRDFEAIADGAAAMNTNFDTASQRFDQIVNSGSLMARSLTSIGLSTTDVGAAMGMAGVPATLLTTAFKGLDEQQRAAIISSAELTKNAGDGAAAASGAKGAWQDFTNALHSALAEMGKQADGFQGLADAAKVALAAIQAGFTVLMGAVNLVGAAVAFLAKSIIDDFTEMGTLVKDVISGNFAAIPGDAKAAEDKISSDLTQLGTNLQNDWGKFSEGVGTAWTAVMKVVGQSSTQAAATAGAAINVLQETANNAQKAFNAAALAFQAGTVSATAYTAALNAMNKAQMDANGGLEQFGTAVLIAANNFRIETVDLMNAKTTLDAVAVAAASGASNWTAYDAALKALNKDQMEFNNGLQDAHTAFLMASEDFQNLGVAQANAETQLQAIVQVYGAAALGTKAYTDALNAQQAAQTAAAQGVTNLATAIQQAANTQATANLTWKNTEIELQAAYTYYEKTGMGLQQVIDLTLKLAQVQAAANNGIEDNVVANDALVASHVALQNALTNANTVLAQAQALYAQDESYAGLYQKALQGVKSAQDALNGTQKTAVSTLTGLAVAQQAVTAAATNAGKPLENLTAYWENVDGAMQAVATTYKMLNGTLVVGSENLTANAGAAQQIQTTYQNMNGTMVVSSQNLSDIAGAAGRTQTSTQNLNGTLVTTTTDLTNLASAAPGAAAGISGVGTAAAGAAAQVKSLGSELDALMGDIPGASLGASLDASMNAAIGNVSANLSPGQTFSQPTGRISGTGMFGDMSDVFMNPYSATSGETLGQTTTYDPLGSIAEKLDDAARAAEAASTGLNSVATASTAVSATSTALAVAMQQVTDANTLEMAAAKSSGTAAYASLKSVADAAAQAAAAALASAEGFTANTAAVDANTAAANALVAANTTVATSANGLSSAALNAGNAVVAMTASTASAATALSTVSTSSINLSGVLSDSAQQTETALMSLTIASQAAAAAALANSKTPVIGSASTSIYTPYATGIGTGSGFGGTPNSAGPTISLTIQNNGTVVGSGGMQQLSDMVGKNIVQTLSARGIRLNRQ